VGSRGWRRTEGHEDAIAEGRFQVSFKRVKDELPHWVRARGGATTLFEPRPSSTSDLVDRVRVRFEKLHDSLARRASAHIRISS
jgi:hypothetical protein